MTARTAPSHRPKPRAWRNCARYTVAPTSGTAPAAMSAPPRPQVPPARPSPPEEQRQVRPETVGVDGSTTTLGRDEWVAYIESIPSAFEPPPRHKFCGWRCWPSGMTSYRTLGWSTCLHHSGSGHARGYPFGL
jgi:hypothetical protein